MMILPIEKKIKTVVTNNKYYQNDFIDYNNNLTVFLYSKNNDELTHINHYLIVIVVLLFSI